ncbi:SHOCT domain-containing protein [Bacillus cereus]|uniref:SHOCT domain-containing protein n=1 Tax=Bacillus cereus TaxID=1396 RepID=UPI00065BA104|nr:SHOCT domain-containing protein [Bacillus cereus]KMP50438.1 hypothetical protein TU59_21230 [Bacillus cereus]MDZ4434685.1 SHOCT domain-containing protein [Bacillus cereus]MDZ4614762.1 SHOCT domain-containing protein [Bacillus cereus]PFQ66330.1 hypothetical protein COK18_07685 [Bacillus cereus]UDV85011.1 SHOCT domain-containing protein [Bacillus cereus]
MLEFKGQLSTLVVTPTKITIKYSRLIGRGSKEIQIKSLTGIQFKPPGFLSHGYIQFVFPGSSEVKTRSTSDLAKDENTVMFNKHEHNNFLKAKDLIEGYMNEQEKNTFASNDHSSTTNPVNTYSVADEITKLAALKDQGILTEEEFTAKKKQLLGI